MPEGVLLRVLPDGGHEFVLEDPVLAEIVLGGRVTLRFGRTDVTVAGPCTLEVDGVAHQLDPAVTGSLAPVLSCHPGSARWLWASRSGVLRLVLMQGQRLVVPGPRPLPGSPPVSTWSVGRPAGDTRTS